MKRIKDIEEFIVHHKKEWNSNIEWYNAFEEADLSEREYIKNMLDNGEDLDAEPRIQVSTIHAAKGGEEDSVILCLDLARMVKKSVKKSDDKHDEEHRVWYVGSTRARNNLYMLKANNKNNEYRF